MGAMYIPSGTLNNPVKRLTLFVFFRIKGFAAPTVVASQQFLIGHFFGVCFWILKVCLGHGE